MVDVAHARVARLAAAIGTYLAAHPGAADTARGIEDWWLPSCGGDASRDELAAALELLVRRRTIAAQRLPDGSVIYRASGGRGRGAAC